jgi:hypothetical protein
MMNNYRRLIYVTILTFIVFVGPSSCSFHTLGIPSAFARSINVAAEASFPFFEVSKLELDSPSPKRGFNLYEGTLLQVLYPSSWTKEAIPLVKYTGLQSVPEVAFYVPNQNVEVIISTERPENVTLYEYFSQEVATLQDSVVGYTYVDSGESQLGNITAREVLYTSDMVEDGTIYGRTKTMEIVSIYQGISYFFIYRAVASGFSTYLPLVQEMIKSIVFKEI